jgi:hypothetical protein
LPFLWREPEVQAKANRLELTVIGHLHSNLVWWKSQLLAGMPVVRFLGNAIRRMSSALHEARHWKPFHVRLCPALSGIELLNDGGYGELNLDLQGIKPAKYSVRRWMRMGRSQGPRQEGSAFESKSLGRSCSN